MSGVEVVGAFAVGMQVLGQVEQAKAEAKGNRAQARVLRFNAQVVEDEAVETARRHRRMSVKREGENVAIIGASGLAMEGSSIDVLVDNAVEEELQALTIEHKGAMEAKSLRMQAGMLDDLAGDIEKASAINVAGSFAAGWAKLDLVG